MPDSKIDNILNDSNELNYSADEPTGQVTTIPLLRETTNGLKDKLSSLWPYDLFGANIGLNLATFLRSALNFNITLSVTAKGASIPVVWVTNPPCRMSYKTKQ